MKKGKKKEANIAVIVVKSFGWLLFILGSLCAATMVFRDSFNEMSLVLMLVITCLSGVLLIGVAEIAEILNDIRQKMNK